MPKAKVEAEVSANINPLKRAFEEAKEKVHEFSEKASEAGKEIEKGFLGKNLSAMLGVGGAIVAIGALTEKLKDFVNEALDGFGKLESKKLAMSLTLRSPILAKELIDWGSEHEGVMGTREDIWEAEQMGIDAGLRTPSAPRRTGSSNLPGQKAHPAKDAAQIAAGPQDLFGMIGLLGNLHVENNRTVSQMMETIKDWSLKQGAGKSTAGMFAGIPEMERVARSFIKSSGNPDQSPEEWGKEHIKTMANVYSMLWEAVRMQTKPGEPSAMEQAKKTPEGIALEFNKAVTDMKDAVASKLAPAMGQITEDFKKDIPAITHVLEVSFGKLAKFLDDMLTGHGIFKVSDKPDMANPLNQLSALAFKGGESYMKAAIPILSKIEDAAVKTNSLIEDFAKSAIGDVQ